ncbi:MAG: hypothetical protein AAGE92_02480 [Cyanobacteria bacterium P01_G01_bin.4]
MSICNVQVWWLGVAMLFFESSMLLSLLSVGVLSFVTTCNKARRRLNRTCILEPVWIYLYAFTRAALGQCLPPRSEADFALN